MEELISELIKDPGSSSTLIWALLIWVLAREFLPNLLKKVRNGKAPFLETIKEKIDYLYGREKDRQAVEQYEASARNRRSSD